ncbi:hexose kinase [Aerococcus tenax]|uniref:hexose kinase n=1 Tax=Aerococcus tenax TaxID=3078812 RepID=UPI0018A7ABC1|nr:hexose kinase [Aerococcus tenax]
MILTVTMNPSIDISYPLEELKIDDVNRVQNVSKTAGGKGLNVARVIHQLNEDVITTGIVGGHHGEFLKAELDKDGIRHKFSNCKGETRDCIAILHEGKQTEVLEPGPTIEKNEIESFIKNFEKLIDQVDVLTISGSLAKGLPDSFYADLIRLSNKKGIKTLLDSSGKYLENALHSDLKPFLIKPNHHELSALLKTTINANDTEGIVEALQNEIFNDIEWIVVSLGADGALVKHENKFFKADIPSINVVNPVGSGDSTIAGLAIAIDKKKNTEEVIKYGMTCGLLNTMNKKTGYVDASQFETYFNKTTITEIHPQD